MSEWKNRIERVAKWQLPTDALRFVGSKNPRWVIGADEVGYGAIAGPYAVAAFLAKITWSMEGVKDSKKMTPNSRKKMYWALLQEPDTMFHVFYASNKEIDKKGPTDTLSQLFHLAVGEILRAAEVRFDDTLIILDGEVRIPIPHFRMPKADNHVPAVSAASIVAKFERDEWMIQQDKIYPQYGFANHKGYGTIEHCAALRQYGPCDIHRVSYEPVTSILKARAHAQSK